MWKRLVHSEASGAPAPAPPPSPVDPREALDRMALPEIVDYLIARLGFDPQNPGWFESLRALHRYSRSKRLQIIPEYFYTPVLSPAELPGAVWDGTFRACGDFDLEKQKAFLRETPSFQIDLTAMANETETDDERSFRWDNIQFSHADAALYYSLIRRFRPRRIVEVGAGHSTKIASRALQANGAGSILCIDPHPPPWLGALPADIAVRREPVQSTPESVFESLEASDMLFIDGSHISKTGSDVNHLFLRVLPTLPEGVLVQIHDICLPFEYPRYWSEDTLSYWNEQYVLAALLANSAKYEILLGVYFLYKSEPHALASYLPSLPGVFPSGGSLWIRSRAPGSGAFTP